MERNFIERWYDATAFGVAMGLAGALVVPVLTMGVCVTLIGGAMSISAGSGVGFGQAMIGLLPLGGCSASSVTSEGTAP